MLTPLKPIGLISLLLAACAGPAGDKGRGIVRTDHTVSLTSSAPAMAGRPVQLYVREVRLAGSARAGGAVRARRRHTGGGGVRRAAPGLQLDGLPRASRVRRLLDGPDRLRSL